jgi:hypothetical protein
VRDAGQLRRQARLPDARLAGQQDELSLALPGALSGTRPTKAVRSPPASSGGNGSGAGGVSVATRPVSGSSGAGSQSTLQAGVGSAMPFSGRSQKSQKVKRRSGSTRPCANCDAHVSPPFALSHSRLALTTGVPK